MISNCNLYEYTKGFLCEDCIYRGTMNFPGLTMGLQQDIHGTVNDALLVSSADQVIPFLQALVKPRISSQYALTCIVNTKSKFSSSKRLTLDEQAEKIARAYGLNGMNLQYLRKLMNTYRKLSLHDSSTFEIKQLYEKVILYRQRLLINDQKWLEIYDQLQTFEERQEAVRSRTTTVIQASLEQNLSRSNSLEQTTRQYHRMLSVSIK